MDSILNYLSFVPFDWIIVILVAFVLTIDTARSGPGRVIAISLAAPATLLLHSAFYNATLINSIAVKVTSPVYQALIFIAMLIGVFFIVRRITDQYGNNGGTIIQSAIGGIGCSIILLVIWFEVPALESLWKFGPQVQGIFSEGYQFWWTAGAFAALAFSRS